MRSIGAAQYALDLLLQRVTDPAKKTFGKYLYEHGKQTTEALVYIMLTHSTQAQSSRISQNLAQKLSLLGCSSIALRYRSVTLLRISAISN